MRQPLASIHPAAKIADNVTIEPFTTIYEDVVIGEGTWIGPNVTIMNGARIGKNCRIFPGAVISAVPQDLKYAGEPTEVLIGDNTTIRECVTINKGTIDKHKTVVGSHCLIMAYVHIAHDCVIGDNCILANAVQVAGHVEIGDSVVVGGTSAIHQFTKIGEHAMIAGGSLVRKDVPPYIKAAREPLAFAGINTIGLRRRGFSSQIIGDIQQIYRHIYFEGMNITKATEFLAIEVADSQEKETILNFIKNSKRGIIRGSSEEDED